MHFLLRKDWLYFAVKEWEHKRAVVEVALAPLASVSKSGPNYGNAPLPTMKADLLAE